MSEARRFWIRLGTGVLLVLLWLSADAAATVYRWTDAQGKLHFAQSLQSVPAPYRAQAQSNAKAPSDKKRVQTYRPTTRMASPASVGRNPAPGQPKVHRVRVQRAGTSLRVMVRLNDRLDRPFLLDTGATDVVVPKRWIEELGMDLSQARTGRYSTANGVVESAKIRLDSVALGDARARNVPASVSDSMSIGLLGLSFLNHFNYQLDPVRGVVTLTENQMVDDGLIRGGRSEAQWRAEFAHLDARKRAIEREQDETPSSHGREHDRLESVLDELDRQLDVLEDEADEARVPFGWRN